MKRRLAGMVVVLTGASSGIGRAAALMFAEAGARLVLAARDPLALEALALKCQNVGAEAIAVPTDVSDEAAVLALARTAVARYGRIDTWVNDAAAYMMGSFEETPAEAQRRLFEVNVLGVVHGTQAALAQFRKQESGVVINVGSVAGKVAYAYASTYCATKHAVHALTEALRQELAGSGIHACIVAPATVDTPLFQHAANFTGREVKAMRPIYPPERVAEAILDCARSPKRETLVGAAPRMMALMQTLSPGAFERIQPRLVRRDHLGEAGASATEGNLYQSQPPHQPSGGWRKQPARKHRLALGAALLLPAALLVAAAIAPRLRFG